MVYKIHFTFAYSDKIDASGPTSLFELLDKIGLPHLGFHLNNSEDNTAYYTNLTPILAGIKKYVNIDYLFQISVEADSNNKTINRITFSKPSDEDIIFPMYEL